GDALAVATDDGVYITHLASGTRWWTRLGSSLPRAIANSIHYDPSDQILALGTQGRGAWTYSLADWPQTGGPGSAVDVRGVAGSYIQEQVQGSPPPYTISAWINLRSGGQTFDPRVAILSSTNCGGNPEFLVRSASTNAIDPQYLELARCGSYNGPLSTVPVPLNQWVHVAVTVSATIGGVSNLVSYYVNGAPAGAFWYVNQNLSFAGNVALAFNNGSTRKFDGLIDQVSFWQTALTSAQIPLIMAQHSTGLPLVDVTRIMSVNFDEGTGTNALGGNNNGSLVGSANWVPSGALFQTVSTLTTLTTRPARNITANGATLEASLAPQVLPTTLQFEYGLTNSYGSAVQQTVTPRTTPTLNGVNNFIATTQARLNPQPFSLSLWFKTTSQQGGRLLGFGDSPTNASGARDRHLYLGTDGLVRFGVFASTPQVITGGTPCNDGRWHHVAGTFSPTNGMRLYLDGTQVASKTSVGAAFAYVGYWRIGWDTISDWPGGSLSGYFAGSLAEVQIWDTELPVDFIAQNYQCQLSGTEAGLASYYHLDDGPGGTVLDSAAAGGA
ncbi:MAG TPA: LamG domain-containing protein, partial [Candidatus Dormibacteraeota bacterium]|nr:LamG domain-containing protein [Candidatus Dormibacteraeota bacterium]